MLIEFTKVRKTAAIVFLGLSAFYLSLSPTSIAGQGYTGEEINSGLRMLAVVNAWVKGRPIPQMEWSRHGPLPVLFDLPFIKLGKMFLSPDFALSFQPVLLTAGIVTVLYLWLRKLCSPAISILLTFTGAFGTMLWPYAYISLETKLSFFLILAGYLGLAGGRIRGWSRLLLFAACCGLAVSLKSTGVVLVPAIAYVVYVQFRDDWRVRLAQVLTLVVVVGTLWIAGSVGRNLYWSPRGGGFNNMRPWLVDSPFQYFYNAIGIFGSPNKGFFVYAPALLASIYAIPRALRTHRDTTVFALLVTAGTVAFLSVLKSPSDEVWGSRYMHVVIAPLLLCIGAAWPRFEWRKHAPVAALAMMGLFISFLGAFYYYGKLDFAAKKTGQNTLEWITGDDDWNHILFNARLFRTWLSGATTPVPWPHEHTWVWTAPPNAQPWQTVDLREFCQPQSFMVRFWNVPKTGLVLKLFRGYVTSLVLGLLFLTWAAVRTLREQRNAQVSELAAVAESASNP